MNDDSLPEVILTDVARRLGGRTNRDWIGPYLPAVNNSDMVWRVDLGNLCIARPLHSKLPIGPWGATASSFLTFTTLITSHNVSYSSGGRQFDVVTSINLEDPKALSVRVLRRALHQATSPGTA